MKNGSKHKLRFGGKDFSGSSVYVLLDEDTKNVSLIADTLLTTSDKGVEDLRDRAVLGVVRLSMHVIRPGQPRWRNRRDEKGRSVDDTEAARGSGRFECDHFPLETVNNGANHALV